MMFSMYKQSKIHDCTLLSLHNTKFSVIDYTYLSETVGVWYQYTGTSRLLCKICIHSFASQVHALHLNTCRFTRTAPGTSTIGLLTLKRYHNILKTIPVLKAVSIGMIINWYMIYIIKSYKIFVMKNVMKLTVKTISSENGKVELIFHVHDLHVHQTDTYIYLIGPTLMSDKVFLIRWTSHSF